MISIANITMQFGAEPLFENISAKFGNGNRYGLIGANGCGKSTLMKIMSGALTPTAGNVSVTPGQTLGELSQDQFAYEQYSVIDTVMMGDRKLWEIKQERERIYSLPEMSEEDGMAVAELESQFAEMDGYTAESRAGDILLQAGIAEELHFGLMSQVAPGWKLRVLLAQALFANPDILLLDEPTNNLDIHTINWLAGELQQRQCTMIIISHDRHFLNATCTHMADIDFGELRVYPGNYDDFVAASSLAREQLLASNAKKEAELSELQDFVNRFGANASKAKQASSRAKRMEKIQLDEVKASSRVHPYIQFTESKKLHRQAVELREVGHAFDDSPLFRGGHFLLEAGSRLAIIGENGVGKSTLLRCLVGELAQSEGTIKWSENASIGYCAQDNSAEFDNDLTVFEWMSQWRTAKHDDLMVRGILGRLLFSADDVNKKAKSCSGGEKNRLMFGKLMMQDINVIVMDEPTNHMDMEAIESLNKGLEQFPGTLIFVSHDREFVSSLATDIIEIKDQQLIHFNGSYDEYLAHLEKVRAVA
ncbi:MULTISPECIES: ABC-F family ATPase [Salinivibrio]|uniref:ABC-F family ATPase n=1 Tax=Salinivibrio siamensis TaxID=414286 RepID=A0ABX3KAW2_9GAMM|nr:MULTISPECIES: ABC-F family ATPase [Salinivibrio]MPS31544.1 ABC-F family ATPase [Salinivibrio sp. VYel7]MPX92939.1 ABC-F family ATPase [Salinivibrio sp. VYel9]MPX95377.1 ABC-F family ATPase [Salinivibrio sp. VYel6]MPX99157.1 ABC-F family ATPase [Salinivibrio sp. VYel4]MPY02136.1 ABC-F family ATPase [Salinivibrio sp. VYel5]